MKKFMSFLKDEDGQGMVHHRSYRSSSNRYSYCYEKPYQQPLRKSI